MLRQIPSILLLSATLLLSACGFTPFLYKTDVVQGNLYTPAEVAQIQIGMTRSEVRRLLGSALLNDPFNPQLDLYPYRYRAGKTNHTYQGSLSIHYNEAGVVSHIEQTPITLVE